MILEKFPKNIVPYIYRAMIDAMETAEEKCKDFKKKNLDNAYHNILWSQLYFNLSEVFESYNMKSYLWKYVSCYIEITESILTFMKKKKFLEIKNNHEHISMYQQAYTYFNKDLDIQLELFDYLNRDVNFLSAYILAPSGEVIDELNLLDYIDPQMTPIEPDLPDNVPTRPENNKPIVGIKDKYLKNDDKGNSK